MARYTQIPRTLNAEGKRYKLGVKYPDIPLSETDIYVYSTEGDRYDTLANQYFQDPSLWWVIQIANPKQPSDSYFPIPGVQLRIPTNISSIISEYENLNRL